MLDSRHPNALHDCMPHVKAFGKNRKLLSVTLIVFVYSDDEVKCHQ